MPTGLKITAASALLLIAGASQAQVQRYDFETTRRRLESLRTDPPRIKTEVVGQASSARARAFLDFYLNKLVPRNERLAELGYQYSSYNLLRDSASHASEAERALWSEEFARLSNEWSAVSVDQQWKADLEEWARLAEGLSGEYPDLARKWAREARLGFMPPELEPVLNETAALMRGWQDAVRVAPAVDGMPEFERIKTRALRDFKDGKITLAEGLRIVHDLHDRAGRHFIGFEAARAAGENLNRVAVLRTRIAKANGYPSWAAYQTEVNGEGYGPEYRGSANQIRHMREFLRALRPIAEAYYDRRLRELGLEDQKPRLTDQDVDFLTGAGWEMLQPHFPDDKITDMWEQTLLASGFRPEPLAQIIVDDESRPGKDRNNKYMSSPVLPHNAVQLIDARTLSGVSMARTRPELRDGFVYILQSYPGNGLNGLRTAFHEGGHATERLLKYKDREAEEAYGYVEVPSLTSEYFLRDPDVVHALAVEVDGRKPGRAEVAAYLRNNAGAELHQLIRLVKRALFDLELWSVDYTAPDAPTFLEAVERIFKEVGALGDVFPEYESKVPQFYEWISTSHFVSGQVRYPGYVYATIGAAMMADFISDELERETGRRGWYHQPGFARIFGEKFVSQGWRQPTPQNLESITGRVFDYRSVIDELQKSLGLVASPAAAGCVDRLTAHGPNPG